MYFNHFFFFYLPLEIKVTLHLYKLAPPLFNDFGKVVLKKFLNVVIVFSLFRIISPCKKTWHFFCTKVNYCNLRMLCGKRIGQVILEKSFKFYICFLPLFPLRKCVVLHLNTIKTNNYVKLYHYIFYIFVLLSKFSKKSKTRIKSHDGSLLY